MKTLVLNATKQSKKVFNNDRVVSIDASNSDRVFALPVELVKAVDNRSYNQILLDEEIHV